MLDLLDLAAADQGRGRRAADTGDQAFDDLEPNGGGECYRLFQPRLFGAAGIRAGFFRDMDDERPAGAYPPVMRAAAPLFGARQTAPSPMSCSWSWIGPIGMTVEIACL